MSSVASSNHTSPNSGLLGAVVLIVTFAVALPGTQFVPSQISASPLFAALLVVSTSASTSIDLSAIAASKSVWLKLSPGIKMLLAASQIIVCPSAGAFVVVSTSLKSFKNDGILGAFVTFDQSKLPSNVSATTVASVKPVALTSTVLLSVNVCVLPSKNLNLPPSLTSLK